MLDLQIPKNSDCADTLFYLTTIERSKRVTQAGLFATAEFCFQGDSTCDVETTVKRFSIESAPLFVVLTAYKTLEEQFKVWRNWELGENSFLFHDVP